MGPTLGYWMPPRTLKHGDPLSEGPRGRQRGRNEQDGRQPVAIVALASKGFGVGTLKAEPEPFQGDMGEEYHGLCKASKFGSDSGLGSIIS